MVGKVNEMDVSGSNKTLKELKVEIDLTAQGTMAEFQ